MDARATSVGQGDREYCEEENVQIVRRGEQEYLLTLLRAVGGSNILYKVVHLQHIR